VQRGQNPGGERDSAPEGAEETSRNANRRDTLDRAVFADVWPSQVGSKSGMSLPPFDTRSQRKLGRAAVVQGQADSLSQHEAAEEISTMAHTL
jgi:hypothetical protein